MRVTSIQLEIMERPRAETLGHVLDLLDRARGSDLILLPELWPCGYFSFARYQSESEPADGPTVQALAGKARELKASLFTGSFVESAAGKLYNTCLLIDPSGEVVARYRKMHLFAYQSEERALLSRGEEVVVTSTSWGRVGFSICYDLRFPELYRRMIDQKAEVFLVAAAWPAARLEPWRLFNRARALESQAFVFTSNGAGTSGGVRLAGHSILVDPFGNVLAEAGDGEELLSIEVDLGVVRKFRREFTALQDRVLH
jgi:predicted amidohydrolase